MLLDIFPIFYYYYYFYYPYYVLNSCEIALMDNIFRINWNKLVNCSIINWNKLVNCLIICVLFLPNPMTFDLYNLIIKCNVNNNIYITYRRHILLKGITV